MLKSRARGLSQFITDTMETGAIASTATTVAAAALGAAELKNPITPLNAVSHILWGDRAAFVEEFTTKHTVTGVALNSAAVTSWAALYELLASRTRPSRASKQSELARSTMLGSAVAGIAYVVDYYLVSKRLTPGFEKRL